KLLFPEAVTLTVPDPVPVMWTVTVGAADATYGPTKGPPLAPAPAGSIDVLLVSLIARSRFSRPLPVWPAVPAASAVSASRLTMTPFDAPTDDALISAAAPATSAADADVPSIGL